MTLENLPRPAGRWEDEPEDDTEDAPMTDATVVPTTSAPSTPVQQPSFRDALVNETPAAAVPTGVDNSIFAPDSSAPNRKKAVRKSNRSRK
jgi:hypothetical protein